MGIETTGLRYYSMLTINQLLGYFGAKADSHQDDFIHLYHEKELEGLRLKLSMNCEFEKGRYSKLFGYLSSPVQALTMQLALAQYMHPPLKKMITELTGSGICPQLAYKLLARADIDAKTLSNEECRYLEGLLVCEEYSDNHMFSGLKADARLAEYLSGSDTLPAKLDGIAQLSDLKNENRYFGNTDRIKLLSDYLEKAFAGENEGFIQLTGKEGSGRKSILKVVAGQIGARFLFVDYGRLEKLQRQEREAAYFLLERELILYDAALCMYNVDNAENDLQSLIFLLEHEFLWLKKPIILATLPDTQLIPMSVLPFVTFELGEDEIDNRIAVWEGCSREYGIDLDPGVYGSKYAFTPGQVSKIFHRIESTKKSTEICSEINRVSQVSKSSIGLERLICRAAVDIIPLPERGSIIRGNSSDTLEDLQLPEAQKSNLYAICSYMRNFYTVFHGWNMQERFSYGRGMTALFAGPAGTGKTMAAGCIANELGLPLYRVDLSQVIDKYIGETEKKLNVVFDYAENANVVLFFDEADALFGKRSEVKESKDKYANAEVSFILQRIEQYEGIVLLATNLINNVDEAFMRRMKHVIMFTLPDCDTRLKIWKGCFADGVPLGDVDFEFLARKIELAGGHIKNIVLNSVFMAASEGKNVSMRHIIPSIQREFVKLGKSVGADYYEEYAHCAR